MKIKIKSKTTVQSASLILLFGAVVCLSGCSQTGFFRNREFDYQQHKLTQKPLLKTPSDLNSPVYNLAMPIPAKPSNSKTSVHSREVLMPPNYAKKIPIPKNKISKIYLEKLKKEAEIQQIQNKIKQLKSKTRSNSNSKSKIKLKINTVNTQPTKVDFKPLKADFIKLKNHVGEIKVYAPMSTIWARAKDLFENSGFKYAGVDQNKGFIFVSPDNSKPGHTQLIYISQLSPNEQLLTLYNSSGALSHSQSGFDLMIQVHSNLISGN